MKGFDFKAIPECGSIADKSLVLYKDTAVIGLFEGRFESNILTFNPANVRTIEKYLKDNDIKIDAPTRGESGPAHHV